MSKFSIQLNKDYQAISFEEGPGSQQTLFLGEGDGWLAGFGIQGLAREKKLESFLNTNPNPPGTYYIGP